MWRLGLMALVVTGIFWAGYPQAQAEETWGQEHRAARHALLKIFEAHPHFREAFTDWLENHPRHAEHLVHFLLADKEHTIEGYIEKEAKHDEDMPHLVEIHKNHPEGMRDFRKWVEDFPKAAEFLVAHPRLVEAIDRQAEAGRK